MKKLFLLLLLCASTQIQSMDQETNGGKGLKEKFNAWRKRRLRRKAKRHYKDVQYAENRCSRVYRTGDIADDVRWTKILNYYDKKLCKDLSKLYQVPYKRFAFDYYGRCSRLVARFEKELEESRDE